jgi:hypothetical protein
VDAAGAFVMGIPSTYIGREVYFSLEAKDTLGTYIADKTADFSIEGTSGPNIPKEGRPGITMTATLVAHKAQWNGKKYTTLKAAVDAVSGSGTLEAPEEIALLRDIRIGSTAAACTVSTGKHIKIIPTGASRNINRTANGFGSLITVASGASLTLEGAGGYTLIFDGGKGSVPALTANRALITVTGTLVVNAGVTLRNNNNTTTATSGGGVNVSGSGTFTMNGGEISGNTGYNGGGVYVTGTNSTFTMQAEAKISGNSATGGSEGRGGGGVFLSGGRFTMNGGEIFGNTVTSSILGAGGGGVLFYSGNFTMGGGEISGNTGRGGGGVFVMMGNFTMNGGEISGNTGVEGGGGVLLAYSSSRFTMHAGAKISGNTADRGGGVNIYDTGAIFTMNGGEIFGNTATAASATADGGGGVYSNGRFVMAGGTIKGYNASDDDDHDPASPNRDNCNVVWYNGAAVSDRGAAFYRTASGGTAVYGGTRLQPLFPGQSGILKTDDELNGMVYN